MRGLAYLVVAVVSAFEMGWSGTPGTPLSLVDRIVELVAAPPLPEGAPVEEEPAGEPPGEARPVPEDLASLCRRYACATRSAGMAIDTDGWIKDPELRRRIVRDDDTHQDETSYLYDDGRGSSLDPTVIRYAVIPKSGFTLAQLGDFVIVEYRGKRLAAVVGDLGPVRKFGEGSWRLATDFGIPNSGNTGGVGSGVSYTFLGGSSLGRAASEEQLLGQLAGLQSQL